MVELIAGSSGMAIVIISLSVHLYYRYYENSSLVEGENVEMIPTYVCT